MHDADGWDGPTVGDGTGRDNSQVLRMLEMLEAMPLKHTPLPASSNADVRDENLRSAVGEQAAGQPPVDVTGRANYPGP